MIRDGNLDPGHLLDQLFTAAPLGLAFLDADLRYLRINDTLAAYNGRPAADHIGLTVEELLPDFAPVITPLYRQVLETGEAVVDYQVRGQNPIDPEQDCVWQSSYFPLYDDEGRVNGICSIVQDITARNETEQALRSQTTFTEDLLNNLPGFILLLNEDGRIVRWNRQVVDRLGYSNSELVGSHMVDIHPQADRLTLRHSIASCLETGHAATESRLLSKDGDELPVFGSSVRVEIENRPHVVVQLVDISEKIAVQSAMEDRLRFETLMAEVTGAFVDVPRNRIDQVIETHLESVAEFLEADRIVLWRHDPSTGLLKASHAWHHDDVPAPPMDMTSEDFKDTAQSIFNGEVIQFSNPVELGEEDGPSRDYMEEHGVRSGLMVPLVLDGRVEAMVALGAIRKARRWNEEDVRRARLLGGVFATSLHRRRSEQELRDAFEHIASLKDRLEQECTILREEVSLQGEHEEIVGDSQALRLTLFRVEQVATTEVTVLILGETGTGKELIARAIHRASRRRERPLVTVNCAALPATLIESELFGYERGAFTGADSPRAGRFEVADGGTLFLDEIGDLPLDLQVKLLRVLQDGEFQRLGSSRTVKSDVRLIAATNRDLEDAVREGAFREDLWYRLNVFPIHVPPLRDRLEDIQELATFFVQSYAGKAGREIEAIPQSVIDALRSYDWPGNIRELQNVIERAVITSTGRRLLLPERLVPKGPVLQSLDRPLEDVERDHIQQVLEDRNWRIEGDRGAARSLDLNPSTLRARMRKLGIKRPSK